MSRGYCSFSTWKWLISTSKLWKHCVCVDDDNDENLTNYIEKWIGRASHVVLSINGNHTDKKLLKAHLFTHSSSHLHSPFIFEYVNVDIEQTIRCALDIARPLMMLLNLMLMFTAFFFLQLSKYYMSIQHFSFYFSRSEFFSGCILFSMNFRSSTLIDYQG